MRRFFPLMLAAVLGACSGAADQAAPPPAPASPTPAPSPSGPAFRGAVEVIDADARAKMGTSWKPGCPVPLHDLRVLRMDHWTFEGTVARGEMIVHEDQAEAVLGAFAEIFEARFPIANMVIANGYIGNDPARAQQNATSAFNCRPAVGSSTLSQHAYGLAVDINPVQNPRVTSAGVTPPDGKAYVDRTQDRPGMIKPGDAVVRAFEKIGWFWGGNYSKVKDYHHFSLTGA
ncbi:MAG TPA: M15 family metallopeptidase [Actinomycetota bacterium]|nr:M15 family metallopeptidase [Actinomycetota bacterium]